MPEKRHFLGGYLAGADAGKWHTAILFFDFQQFLRCFLIGFVPRGKLEFALIVFDAWPGRTLNLLNYLFKESPLMQAPLFTG